MRHPRMNGAEDPITVVLTGQLPFVILAAGLLAVPVSCFQVRLYRPAVIKLMRSQLEQSWDRKSPDSPNAATESAQLQIQEPSPA